MLNVHFLSPQNETQLVNALADEIRRTWPDVVADPVDRIDLLVGVRAGVDVDLLIALDFEAPRTVPLPRRADPRRPVSIGSALIAVEIKQLDASLFERIGNQLFPIYRGQRSARSCAEQARDAAYGIKNFAAASGFPELYVHALAWLTQLDEELLEGIDPAVLGATGWGGILAAACKQRPALGPGELTRTGVRAVCNRLLLRSTLTSLDRLKVERIARDALVRDLVAELAPGAGNAMIRLLGHGGSGKTTALLLLAVRLATHYNARVLILTFHYTLSGDIRHILEGMSEAQGLVGERIHVETATPFLLELVEAAGGSVPRNADSTPDYDRVQPAFREVANALRPEGREEFGQAVIDEDRARFDWDHVLIDEAQDWSDEERDILLAVYGFRRVVLADGLVQLIRRQTSCNWLLDIPKNERLVRELGDSLRMQRNVALFANSVAQTMDFSTWRIEPRPDLLGGRVVVLEGELGDAVALVRALETAGSGEKADPVDNLICVPPSEIVVADRGARRARLGLELRAAGEAVWDACDPFTRTGVPEGARAWRIVQYDSCRGLEGWATLLVALDDLYANKLKYPNIVSTDRAIDPEVVARRWLLIPLTRAVHLLVVHVRDPDSPVAAILREAAAGLPQGVVEFCPASEGPRRLAGSPKIPGRR